MGKVFGSPDEAYEFNKHYAFYMDLEYVFVVLIKGNK